MPLASPEKLAIRSKSVQGLSQQFNETKSRSAEIEDLVLKQKAKIDAQAAEIRRLKDSKEKYERGYRTARGHIAELEHELIKVSGDYEEALAKQDQQIRAMESRISRILPTARSTGFFGTQPPSSTTNRVSEAEVLGIVLDLNENVFQVAAGLTEEWERHTMSMRSNRLAIAKEDIDTFSRSYSSALVSKVSNRDSVAVTFLVQSCLCELAAQITSSWQHDDELRLLRSVYRLLSPSGEYGLHGTSKVGLTRTRETGNLS